MSCTAQINHLNSVHQVKVENTSTNIPQSKTKRRSIDGFNQWCKDRNQRFCFSKDSSENLRTLDTTLDTKLFSNLSGLINQQPDLKMNNNFTGSEQANHINIASQVFEHNETGFGNFTSGNKKLTSDDVCTAEIVHSSSKLDKKEDSLDSKARQNTYSLANRLNTIADSFKDSLPSMTNERERSSSVNASDRTIVSIGSNNGSKASVSPNKATGVFYNGIEIREWKELSGNYDWTVPAHTRNQSNLQKPGPLINPPSLFLVPWAPLSPSPILVTCEQGSESLKFVTIGVYHPQSLFSFPDDQAIMISAMIQEDHQHSTKGYATDPSSKSPMTKNVADADITPLVTTSDAWKIAAQLAEQCGTPELTEGYTASLFPSETSEINLLSIVTSNCPLNADAQMVHEVNDDVHSSLQGSISSIRSSPHMEDTRASESKMIYIDLISSCHSISNSTSYIASEEDVIAFNVLSNSMEESLDYFTENLWDEFKFVEQINRRTGFGEQSS